MDQPAIMIPFTLQQVTGINGPNSISKNVLAFLFLNNDFFLFTVFLLEDHIYGRLGRNGMFTEIMVLPIHLEILLLCQIPVRSDQQDTDANDKILEPW